MNHSHLAIHARPDHKIAPEQLMSRQLTPGLNRVLKHSAAKKRRQHDHVVYDYMEVAA
jgi:hypothetical protein